MSSGLDDRESGFTMFSDEELRDMSGVKRDADHVEITCGCTSHRYGDAVGRLRVFLNGSLEITCQCTPSCHQGLFNLFSFLVYIYACVLLMNECDAVCMYMIRQDESCCI